MIGFKFLRNILIIFSLLNINSSYANDTIFYIDMQFVMNNSLAGKSIINKLNKKTKTNQTKFTKIEEVLKKEETEIVSQKNILEKDKYNNKVKNFKDKVSKYQLERKKTLNEISDKKIKAQGVLANSLTPILAEYAKKNSINFILRKESIIIGKSALDLTQIILKLLDEKIKDIKLD